MKERKNIWSIVCVGLLGAGLVQAADSEWQGNDGNWFAGTNWSAGVPNEVNGLTPAIKGSGTITLDSDLTGTNAVVGWYQETGGSTFQATDRYIEVQGDLNLVATWGSSAAFNLYGPSWSELFVNGHLNFSTPTWAQRGYATMEVNGGGARAYFMGNINFTSDNLANQGANSEQKLSLYQSPEVYTLTGLYMNMVSGIGQGDVSVTNKGILAFSGWDNQHYGSIIVGTAKNAENVWSTNQNTYVTLTSGAYLQVDQCANEPVANFSKTLIHDMGTNYWSGAFEEILLTGDSVELGEWVVEDTYDQNDTDAVWYYRLERTAFDADGIPNDLVLNVNSNPPPEAYSLSILGGSDAVTVMADGIPAYGTNYLQSCINLVSPVWTNIAEVGGVTSNSWVVTPLVNTQSYYRVQTVY